jgi:hypothetical protein
MATANLTGVPEDAMESSGTESPISHMLTRTRGGWRLRRSRFPLYFSGVPLAMGFAAWRLLARMNADPHFIYAAAGVLGGTSVLLLLYYAGASLLGLSVSFDSENDELTLLRGWTVEERYPLHELAAVQMCYRYAVAIPDDTARNKQELAGGAQRNQRGSGAVRRAMTNWLERRFAEGKPLEGDQFQVVLVRRDGAGVFTRNLVVSCPIAAQARKLAGRMAETLGVPFLDSASPERVNRTRTDYLRAGGEPPKPNEGPSTWS